MAVLVTAEVQGQAQQGYDDMFAVLADGLRQAPGFVLHTAHPIEGGWRVIEVWESEADANEFFVKHVAPHLPRGIRPKRAVQDLHSLLIPLMGVTQDGEQARGKTLSRASSER